MTKPRDDSNYSYNVKGFLGNTKSKCVHFFPILQCNNADSKLKSENKTLKGQVHGSAHVH